MPPTRKQRTVFSTSQQSTSTSLATRRTPVGSTSDPPRRGYEMRDVAGESDGVVLVHGGSISASSSYAAVLCRPSIVVSTLPPSELTAHTAPRDAAPRRHVDCTVAEVDRLFSPAIAASSRAAATATRCVDEDDRSVAHRILSEIRTDAEAEERRISHLVPSLAALKRPEGKAIRASVFEDSQRLVVNGGYHDHRGVWHALPVDADGIVRYGGGRDTHPAADADNNVQKFCGGNRRLDNYVSFQYESAWQEASAEPTPTDENGQLHVGERNGAATRTMVDAMSTVTSLPPPAVEQRSGVHSTAALPPRSCVDHDHVMDGDSGQTAMVVTTRQRKKRMNVVVVNEDCFVVAQQFAARGYYDPFVMDAGSRSHFGGGFRSGARAQEEELCRRSTLAQHCVESLGFRKPRRLLLESGMAQVGPAVDGDGRDGCRPPGRGAAAWVDRHRRSPFQQGRGASTGWAPTWGSAAASTESGENNSRGSGGHRLYPLNPTDGVYVPGVTVFRHGQDARYALMSRPFTCGIGVISATNKPRVANNRIDDPGIVADLRGALTTFFLMAKDHGHRAIVPVAVGCGAFQNPAEHVAQLFVDVLFSPMFVDCFDEVCFAVLDDHNAFHAHNPRGNFAVFSETVQRRLQQEAASS